MIRMKSDVLALDDYDAVVRYLGAFPDDLVVR